MKKSTLIVATAAAAALVSLLTLTPGQTIGAATPISSPIALTTVGAASPFLAAFSDGAKWGPGIVDSQAPLAGPGPWGILLSQSGVVTTRMSVHNLGDRTVELYRSDTSAVIGQVAGGQTQTFPLSLPAAVALLVRFVGSGTDGRIVWVGRD